MNGCNGPYTLITGASEGLGKAMAIQCAERRRNLILVSLPGIELYQLASYIRCRYHVLVCELELDLSLEESRVSLWRTLVEHNLAVNMLINNAGCGGFRAFADCDFDQWQKQIQLNIVSVVHLTHLILPVLKKHPQSHILNISSLCIFFNVPGKQVYAAGKAFIYSFSKSLRRELKRDGISVSVLCPGGITTTPLLYLLNTRGSWITRLSSMTPEKTAAVALKGMLRGKETIIPGRCSRLFVQLDRWIPAFIKNHLIEGQVTNRKQHYFESLITGHAEADYGLHRSS
jgi:short-subunit dehydrogenase